MKEGRVAIEASADGKKVAMVEVDCETGRSQAAPTSGSSTARSRPPRG
jgi:hypothetical protein